MLEIDAAAIAVVDISEDFNRLTLNIITTAQGNGFDLPQINLHKLDVTNENSICKSARLIEEESRGQLDLLFNNAGYLRAVVGNTRI